MLDSFRLSLSAIVAAACLAPAMAGAAPSLAGVWVIQPDYQMGQPLKPPPDLTPYAKDLARKRNEATDKGYVRSVGNMLCTPQGGPSLFLIRSPFVIMEGLGRVVFIFETEGSNQPRSVYLNQKPQPDAIYPSFNGHSIGHWEGETLVVDTIGFNGRGGLLGGVPKSTETHVVERFTLAPDGKTLRAQITMEDPKALATPWTTTIAFNRMSDEEERFEVWCEPDLDAFKNIDLEAMKDFDPEIALLLDPNQRPSDPALKIAPGK